MVVKHENHTQHGFTHRSTQVCSSRTEITDQVCPNNEATGHAPRVPVGATCNSPAWESVCVNMHWSPVLASRHVKGKGRDSPQPVYEMMAVWRWPALQAVNVATALNWSSRQGVAALSQARISTCPDHPSPPCSPGSMTITAERVLAMLQDSNLPCNLLEPMRQAGSRHDPEP